MIARDVKSLKTNLDAIEEKAREDLGMIKDGEVFYLVTDKNSKVLKESEISEEPRK
jgi:cell division protein FtsB